MALQVIPGTAEHRGERDVHVKSHWSALKPEPCTAPCRIAPARGHCLFQQFTLRHPSQSVLQLSIMRSSLQIMLIVRRRVKRIILRTHVRKSNTAIARELHCFETPYLLYPTGLTQHAVMRSVSQVCRYACIYNQVTLLDATCLQRFNEQVLPGRAPALSRWLVGTGYNTKAEPRTY
jgi:hypothetical protein